MRIRYVATIVEMLRKDAETLAREYLSARDAEIHEFLSEGDRAAYVDLVFALGRFLHRPTFEQEVADLDAAPATVEAEQSAQHLMRPIVWNFGEGTTFPGYTDDTRWNGFINVWVTPATWPYVLAELIAGADGDADLIGRYQRTPEVDGLVSLSHDVTTNEVQPAWSTMFIDYPVAEMMPIPAGWTEMSWRNETAPSFGPCVGPMGEAAQIWIDYEQPAKREIPESERFTFCRRDAIGELTVVYTGDDYGEALRHVAIEVLACDFAHRLAQQLDPSDWREMRIRNRNVEAGVCASHDFLDANMVMLAAWQATRDPAIVGNGDATALGCDLDHVNAAWTIATRDYLTASDEAARFDDWRVTGHDVSSLAAEGHDLATIPPSDSAGRVYKVGFIQAHGNGWIVDVAITNECFEHLIDAEAHLWSVFASNESRHV